MTAPSAGGLEQKFRDIVAAHAPAMRRLCGVYASRASDRDDLHQEIFLAVWKALPRFREESSERTWIYSIAHNVALTWKARGRKHGARSEDQLGENVASAVSHEPDVRRMALSQLISRLPALDRELVTLWLEGLTMAEMSEVTGIRAGTVAVRLTRIRQTLSDLFEPKEACRG